MRESCFARYFSGAIEDPVQREKDKIAFVLDAPLQRNDEDERVHYLARKYGTGPLLTMGLAHMDVTAPVSRT